MLEYVFLLLFYGRSLAYAEVMRSAIALNGSFFDAQHFLVIVAQNLWSVYLAAGQRGEGGMKKSPNCSRR